ncbi:aminoglycoside phosphotransferase family protein [Paraflavitalea sp. CAU 1676]|uniref:phosphotransferase enzyme family protein n=1 Tax=Paraflavitalea sp. CAU 1676 TaxID=3032598 RepID=UPI0023DA5B9A|nr:aminoglycoside phosphotransferase family protein [Paraflavitalea sp. CAU 1676]MDF2193425.1 aminoglycoside phosphotransferase family protein [Paraflavitalea sp. CAU 1676]
MFKNILAAYGLETGDVFIEEFGMGLINKTWKVTRNDHSQSYILQKINHAVFKQPADIAFNVAAIADHLQKQHPEYLFITPLQTLDGQDLFVVEGDGYYRMAPFLEQSCTLQTVQAPKQAFEAARQFGRFTSLCASFDASRLKVTIPDFHNLPFRYQQFTTALEQGNKERKAEMKELIAFLQSQSSIITTYNQIAGNPAFSLRVTHHDTKISNVLFDTADNGLCVIDLDTVMPGYFISDVGDMMRTYLCPVNEEETDLSLITVREDYFQAIVAGYLSAMQPLLSREEKQHFVYAGKFLIYMQALRFLTDYLNNDVYYKARHPRHNADRAENQAALLQQLLDKEPLLNSIVTDALYAAQGSKVEG